MSVSRLTSVFIVAAAILCYSCAELPKDQSGTIDGIRKTGRMRVGLIESPPWVIRTNGEPAGAEVELIKQFASELGAQPEWHWGGEENLLGALEKYELDVVVGGISDQTPWSKRVGLTRYYFEEKFDVGRPSGNTTLSDLKGQEVAVQGPRVAAFVRQKGATPIQVDSVENVGMRPVAAADWQLARLGLTASGNNLHTDKHVIAVPPGENQMVKRLEEFLTKQHDNIPTILQQQPEVPQ